MIQRIKYTELKADMLAAFETLPKEKIVWSYEMLHKLKEGEDFVVDYDDDSPSVENVLKEDGILEQLRQVVDDDKQTNN